MRLTGAPFATLAISLIAIAGIGGSTAVAGGRHGRERVRVRTDGHLTPGHLEAIRVSGFPGRGKTEVSFFPTAICEEECGGRGGPGGPTDADGSATLEVRVPSTFINGRGGSTPFRDGERIDVEVTWEGAGHSFAHGSAEPEPTIVRDHGGRRG